MLPQLARFQDTVLDLLFPQRCLGCGKEGAFFCIPCQHLLPRIMPPVCPKCGRHQLNGILCHECVNWQTEIDGFRAPFRFDGVIREAVHQLKYKNLRALATPLTRLLYDYLSTNPVSGEVLVPVPMHPKRLRERGYNQSVLLARKLGKLTNLEVIDNCLQRIKLAPPQARTLTVEERKINVSGAFSCRDRRMKGKRVLLIDDVCTSGATLEACAAAVKRGGASSVWGLTLAREI